MTLVDRGGLLLDGGGNLTTNEDCCCGEYIGNPCNCGDPTQLSNGTLYTIADALDGFADRLRLTELEANGDGFSYYDAAAGFSAYNHSGLWPVAANGEACELASVGQYNLSTATHTVRTVVNRDYCWYWVSGNPQVVVIPAGEYLTTNTYQLIVGRTLLNPPTAGRLTLSSTVSQSTNFPRPTTNLNFYSIRHYPSLSSPSFSNTVYTPLPLFTEGLAIIGACGIAFNSSPPNTLKVVGQAVTVSGATSYP